MITADPRFLESPSGRLFTVQHRPARSGDIRGNVLFVPAFSEEMNRSRSLITQQALRFAEMGYASLVVDLYGTGDSTGDFCDTRWALWRRDVEAALRWLQTQPGGGCTAMVGIRLGAILAAQSIEAHAPNRAALILWQPVTDGKSHLTQFLRIRMAAMLDRPNLPKETPATMRARFAAGQSVEIGGYDIHPELAAAIEPLRLADHKPDAAVRVLWLDNASDAAAGPSPTSEKVIDDWRAGGVAVEHRGYPGPAFWQAYDRVETPALIDQTSAWFQQTIAAR